MQFADGEIRDDVKTGEIKLHKAADFDGMRKAGRLAALTLDMVAGLVRPGVTTGFIDDRIREFVFDHQAVSATIGYRGYRHASGFVAPVKRWPAYFTSVTLTTASFIASAA